MNEEFNTDYKKASQALESYIQELSQEKLLLSVKLKVARNRIQELEEEIIKLKSDIESL